jgi:hypothetical protein
MRLLMVAGCVASALLGAAAPSAAAGWTPPVSVSVAGSTAREPEVAVDGAGNTTVVWGSGTGSSRSIRSAYRPAGGPWEMSVTLIPASADCFNPQLAVNPVGAAVVVAECDAGTAGVQAAYRAAGGRWAGSIAVPGSGSGVDPRVAIDDDGNAVVVWGSANAVQSSYRPAAGPWGAAVQASPAGDVALDPQIAISPTGRALAIWRHDLSPSTPVVTVETTSRQDAGPWGATPTVLTPPATSTVPVAEGEPQVAWNDTGGRFAVWANRTTAPRAILQSGWGGGDFGSWGMDASSHSAGDGVRSVEVPQVAIDDEDRAVAVWRGFDGGTGSFRTQAATTGFINDSWSAPITLADVETGLAEPHVAVDPAGDATVVWRTIAGEISAVSRPAGGAFAPATPISNSAHPGFGDPLVTMDASGDAIVAWSASDATATHIAVAVDDVSPPLLSAIDIPPSAETGVAATMAATATDAWSPVHISWNFGDGATGAGDTVNHAYATAGTRTVTVTATDAAGNSASQTRQIVVTTQGGGRLNLDVTVPRQSWKKIKKAKAVSLRCTMDAIGECKAVATVSRTVAKRLGLKVKRPARTLRIGSGSTEIESAGHATKLRVRLTRKARAAIGKASRNVPLKLAVTGSAPERLPATLVQKLKIRR